MGIRLEKSILQKLFEVGRDAETNDVIGVDIDCFEGGTVVDFNAGEIFEGEDASGCVLPVDFRDKDMVLVCEVTAEMIAVFAFLDVINFLIKQVEKLMRWCLPSSR